LRIADVIQAKRGHSRIAAGNKVVDEQLAFIAIYPEHTGACNFKVISLSQLL
jgi:hypothetical protein